jgi:integrase
VFAGAGVRIGEAIAMTVGSVEAAERSPRLRVLGKGNKPRVIPVGPEVIAAIDAYLQTRAERVSRDLAPGARPRLAGGNSGALPRGCHSPTDPLFVRKVKGDYVPFNRQALDALVAGWFRRAGVTPPPGSLAHALRHTYATLLVDAGGLATRSPAAVRQRRPVDHPGLLEGGGLWTRGSSPLQPGTGPSSDRRPGALGGGAPEGRCT